MLFAGSAKVRDGDITQGAGLVWLSELIPLVNCVVTSVPARGIKRRSRNGIEQIQ